MGRGIENELHNGDCETPPAPRPAQANVKGRMEDAAEAREGQAGMTATPYEELRASGRAAVPGIQAQLDRVFALAAAEQSTGRRRALERLGMRCQDYIKALLELP
jgi:hypothetical protein